MKKYVLLSLVLVIGLIPGLANRVGTGQSVICGEIWWNYMSECGEYVDIMTCDEQLVCIHTSLIPPCNSNYIMIVNPYYRYNRDFDEDCIVGCDYVKCIDSCSECEVGPCEEWLYVVCNESRYDLYVDGQFVLTEDGDGKAGIKLVEGRHTVQLKKDGCDTITKTIDIICGRSTTLTVTMNCDPCKNVSCPDKCDGDDLWSFTCDDGDCVKDYLIEKNSRKCGYDPCKNVSCPDKCDGDDLWSFTCDNGKCVKDYLIEKNSRKCGYDPCENHCYNGEQDCGEDGVDCGGNCSRECPSNMVPLVLTAIGGAVVVGGGFAYQGLKGRRPPSQQRTASDADQPRTRREPGQQATRELPDHLRTIRRLADRTRTARDADQPRMRREPSQQTRDADQPRMRREPSQQTRDADQPRLTGEQVSEPTSEDTMGREAAEKTVKEAAKKAEKRMTEEHKIQKKITEKTAKRAGKKLMKEAAKKVKTKGAETKAEDNQAKSVSIGTVLAKKRGVTHCPQCGEKLPPRSKVCSKCGYKS